MGFYLKFSIVLQFHGNDDHDDNVGREKWKEKGENGVTVELWMCYQ